MVWYRNPGNEIEMTEAERHLILRALTALQLIARKHVEFSSTPGKKERNAFHQLLYESYLKDLEDTTELIEKVKQYE